MSEVGLPAHLRPYLASERIQPDDTFVVIAWSRNGTRTPLSRIAEVDGIEPTEKGGSVQEFETGGLIGAWQEFTTEFVGFDAGFFGDIARDGGAVRADVLESTTTIHEDIDNLPIIGPLNEAAEGTARGLGQLGVAAGEFGRGLAGIAGLLPILLVAGIAFIVMQGGVKIKL